MITAAYIEPKDQKLTKAQIVRINERNGKLEAQRDTLLAEVKQLRSKFPLNGSTAQELDAMIAKAEAFDAAMRSRDRIIDDWNPPNRRAESAELTQLRTNCDELLTALKDMIAAHGKLPSWPPTQWADTATRKAQNVIAKVEGRAR